MHIYSHETERIHQLQRQLHDDEQFRTLVREMRIMQRRCRRKRDGLPSDLRELRARLEAAVDSELRLLDSE